jgi:hypothetical protein
MLLGQDVGSFVSRAEQVQAALEAAHKRSVSVPADEQAQYVQDVLGARLAAAALGIRDTRTLQSWGRGGAIKGLDQEHRLQALYRATVALSDAFSPSVAAAFLRGSNPTLNGRAPMLVLADDPPAEAETQVMTAVEALLDT